MKKTKIQHLLLGAGTVAMTAASMGIASTAMAAGFQVTTHSAEGLGRAYAGEGAVTDSASAVAKNPAAALELKTGETAISVSAVHTFADVNVVDINATPGVDGEDLTSDATSPAISVIHKPIDRLAVGVTLKSDFASEVDYTPDHVATDVGTAGGATEIETRNLGLHAALQVTPKLSAGVTVQYVQADAELTRYSGGNAIVNMADGEDDNIAYTLGTLYKAAPGHQYAVIYRSKQRLELNGDVSGAATLVPGTARGQLIVELPETLSFAGTNQVTDKTSIQYSAEATRWDRIESLLGTGQACNFQGMAPGVCFIGAQDRKNSRRFAVGVTHDLNAKMKVRGGVATDSSSYGNGTARFSSPDGDRIWVSTGMTYKTSNAGTVDAGLTYVDVDDADVADGALTGTFDAKGILIGAQYNHKF